VFTFEDGTQYIGPFESDRMMERQVEIKDSQEFQKTNKETVKAEPK